MIAVHELGGKDHAEYGAQTLWKLSTKLKAELGRGYSATSNNHGTLPQISSVCYGGWPGALPVPVGELQLVVAKDLFWQTAHVDVSAMDEPEEQPFRPSARCDAACVLYARPTKYSHLPKLTSH